MAAIFNSIQCNVFYIVPDFNNSCLRHFILEGEDPTIIQYDNTIMLTK